ncbi:probable ATP-dependent DNA helicase HFM1 [Galleria mellonella]|uniref:DNA 3'-5' helicase n=1 Tax=Galleria mellonella TaxID=7137 RepID=A0ABM3M876_GALME|nr:probable ATP-dependent DNA helicase HFM1 [Galleria mellonella]
MESMLCSFTDILSDEVHDSQPISLSSSSNINNSQTQVTDDIKSIVKKVRPSKRTGQYGDFRSIDEIDPKYRDVFSYPFFNLVQSKVIEDALYSDKSIVVSAPTGSGKTVVFEMAIVQLLMDMDDKNYTGDFKIIYMAPVKALCTERLTEWYPKFTQLGLLCIEVTGDTDVDFNQLKPYRIIITTPEKWDMLTRRWRDHRGLVEVIKLFLIDEVHILNDEVRGPVLEAVVSRMKTIESSALSAYRIEQLKKQYSTDQNITNVAIDESPPPRIRFIAVSATVSNPEDVATWLGTSDKPAVYFRFGDECRPVKLKRVVEGYPCSEGTSIFKFDITLNYKLWPIIQKYHNGKPTLIFCNTRKSVILTAETLSREITINFNSEQKAKLMALASTIKNKKLQSLILAGVACHHAGLLFEERNNIEKAFRNRDLPILITTTTLAMGVNLPAHLVIIKNTQQYVNGAYQEYSISTVLQMVGRAGRPQYDTEATAVIMTRLNDKPRYQALVCGSEPLQSYLHKRLAENLNSEAALGTVSDVAQCVQWLRSTFLYVRAARDPRRYLGLPTNAPNHMISKKIEELCVRAMNGLATAGLITMDEASCIESTEAGRLMSVFYLDLETMKHIMKVEGTESLDRLLWLVCESHELADMHLRVDERRCLNALNRNNAAATIRFPMKGKISTRQMKLNCIIQAVLGCLPIPDPSLNQEAMKIMRIAERVCKCLVAYVTRPDLMSQKPKYYTAIVNSIVLAKCIAAHLWENSPYVSRQMKGIGPTFSTLLATAGKTNFMLLEESHPRDLERIMNKGPPAGNVLRKQISLLPKYQIKMTPVDEKTVSVHVELLNQSYLSENMEHLTAGESHKSYIIVGDSENHILLLTSFKDKDLIGMYDASITYHITRKHNYEHKIIVNCISSNFVGIDAQCEYVFKDLEHTRPNILMQINENVDTKQTMQKDIPATDSFRQRKRKNNNIDITLSKEKKKREEIFAQRMSTLKESFEKTSKEVKDNLRKSGEISKNLLNELVYSNRNELESEITPPSNLYESNITEISMDVEQQDNEVSILENELQQIGHNEFSDNHEIDNILNKIESEISKVKTLNNKTSTSVCTQKNIIKSSRYNNRSIINKHNKANSKCSNIKKIESTNQTNYAFIDLLEKQLYLTNDNEHEDHSRDTKFSDTIKLQLDDYLQKIGESVNKPKYSGMQINELLNEETDEGNILQKEDSYDSKNNIDSRLSEETLLSANIDLINNNMSTFHNIKLHNVVDSKRNTQTTHNLSNNNIVKTINEDKEKKKNQNNDNCNSDLNNCLMLYKTLMPNTKDILIVKQLNLQPILVQSTRCNISPDLFSNKPNITINFDQNLKEILHYNHRPKLHTKTEYQSMSNITPMEMENCTKPMSKFIKQYSYSSSEIKITTHNTINCQICIMKRLSIDLDVREIVSKRNEKTDHNVCNFKTFNKHNGRENKSIELQDSIEYIDRQCSISKSSYSDINNKVDNMENVNKIKMMKKERQNLKTDLMDSNSTCDVKLENILQRYSQILKKNDNHAAKVTTEINNNKTYEVKIEEEKRPFKITDINKIHISLPEVITESIDSKRPNISQTTEIKTNYHDKQLLQTNDNIEKEVHFNTESNSTDSDILPDTIAGDLYRDDFKIDQSMFNPKTLLQCLTKEDSELIIPPPIEFRDTSYSPGHEQEPSKSYLIDIDNPFLICDKNSFIEEDFELNNDECIYKEILNDEHIRSQKTVETWPISQEIYREKSEPSQNTWTVDGNFTEGTNRHSKLNQFKFMHKDKYKRL